MADASGKFNLLAVDDSPDIVDLIELTLRADCNVKRALDGAMALQLALEKPRPDLILLDVEMPGANGYDVCKTLKASPVLADVPVIFLTQRDDAQDVIKGFQLGAIDYFTKPINPPVLAARIRAHIELINRRNRQEEMIVERSAQLEHTRLQLIRRLGRAMEYHETSAVGNRVVRLGHYARHLAQAAGARPALCDLMMKAAPLHDIGKLGVPVQILRKTEKLSIPEREQMQRHAEIGAEIIGEHDDPLLKLARTLALTHHERWDGTGYPSGASGNDIPWPGRVMAVVDAFEGMTATQFHREPIPVDIAGGEIIRAAGKQFDPQIIEAFKKALPEFRNVRETYADALGDMLNLDFVASPAPVRVSEPQAIDADETVRTMVGKRALQALREGDEARAKALGGMQARLTMERDLAAAATKDLSSQQAARRRAEEASAREAESLELTRQRIAEVAAAARAAQERAQADTNAAAAARRTEEAKAQLLAEIEARASAEQAQALAAAEKRGAWEGLARTEEALAASLARESRTATPAGGAATATWMGEERAEIEAKLAGLQRQLNDAQTNAGTEAQARVQAELALATSEARRAKSEQTAPRRDLPIGNRMLIVAPILLVFAVAAVLFLRAEAPSRDAAKSLPPSLQAVELPQPIAALPEGTPLELRLDRNVEKLAPRGDGK
jgi:putative two-component system response regulator